MLLKFLFYHCMHLLLATQEVLRRAVIIFFGATGRSQLHLFGVDIPEGISFKESDDITPGDLGLCVVDTDVGRLAIGICYDIRFPEMAMLYAGRGAHIICYPAAFNMTTGPVHWELLQKARFGASASYINWGHSTIVGPGPENSSHTYWLEWDSLAKSWLQLSMRKPRSLQTSTIPNLIQENKTCHLSPKDVATCIGSLM